MTRKPSYFLKPQRKEYNKRERLQSWVEHIEQDKINIEKMKNKFFEYPDWLKTQQNLKLLKNILYESFVLRLEYIPDSSKGKSLY